MKRIIGYQVFVALFLLTASNSHAENLDQCLASCQTSDCFANCAQAAGPVASMGSGFSSGALAAAEEEYRKARADAERVNGEINAGTMKDPFEVHSAIKRLNDAAAALKAAREEAKAAQAMQIENMINGQRLAKEQQEERDAQQLIQMLVMEGNK